MLSLYSETSPFCTLNQCRNDNFCHPEDFCLSVNTADSQTRLLMHFSVHIFGLKLHLPSPPDSEEDEHTISVLSSFLLNQIKQKLGNWRADWMFSEAEQCFYFSWMLAAWRVNHHLHKETPAQHLRPAVTMLYCLMGAEMPARLQEERKVWFKEAIQEETTGL